MLTIIVNASNLSFAERCDERRGRAREKERSGHGGGGHLRLSRPGPGQDCQMAWFSYFAVSSEMQKDSGKCQQH